MFLTLPIRDVTRATPRARLVRIDLNGASFPYRAGQALRIASHARERRRTYSIASAPEDAEREKCLELLIGVDAEGRAGPDLALEPQALVDIEGPLGQFTFPEHPEQRRFLFIAGGTGIAPLRAMMRHALHLRPGQIGVFYSARTPEEFAFQDELRDLAHDGRIELRQTITRDPDNALWTGPRGRIGRDDLAPLVHDPATLCFICGPPALVDDIPKLLGELDVPQSRIRIEEWG